MNSGRGGHRCYCAPCWLCFQPALHSLLGANGDKNRLPVLLRWWLVSPKLSPRRNFPATSQEFSRLRRSHLSPPRWWSLDRIVPRRLVRAARPTVRPDFALRATDPARVPDLPVYGRWDQAPLESGLIARHRALGLAGPREPALMKEPGRGRVKVLSA